MTEQTKSVAKYFQYINERLAVNELPPGTKTNRFWEDWDQLVQEPPIAVIAFGREERGGEISPRVRNLVNALKSKTHIQDITIKTLPIIWRGYI